MKYIMAGVQLKQNKTSTNKHNENWTINRLQPQTVRYVVRGMLEAATPCSVLLPPDVDVHTDVLNMALPLGLYYI